MQELIDFEELKASNRLPSPRGVMLNVMLLCRQEEVSLNELAKQIQADPVLAGRIIKLGNVVNPNRNRPVASVTTKVLLMVGVHAVRQVILGIALVTANRSGNCKAFDYPAFWSRSIAMACAAQVLSQTVTIAPIVEMFTCGLLANVGRLGLASARPDTYSRLLEENRALPGSALLAAERAHFGMDHLDLSAAMMRDWNIPDVFGNAALCHEDPETCREHFTGRQKKLVNLLHTAGQLADYCLLDPPAREAMLPEFAALAEAMEIDAAAITGALAQTVIEWQEWSKVLGNETEPYARRGGMRQAS